MAAGVPAEAVPGPGAAGQAVAVAGVAVSRRLVAPRRTTRRRRRRIRIRRPNPEPSFDHATARDVQEDRSFSRSPESSCASTLLGALRSTGWSVAVAERRGSAREPGGDAIEMNSRRVFCEFLTDSRKDRHSGPRDITGLRGAAAPCRPSRDPATCRGTRGGARAPARRHGDDLRLRSHRSARSVSPDRVDRRASCRERVSLLV